MDHPHWWKRRIAGFAALILLAGCAQQEVSLPATATGAASTPAVTAVPSVTALPTETTAPTATITRTITPTPTLDPDWGQVSVSCHPSTSGDTWGIYLTDSEFSFAERITLPGVNYHFPQFSPDGNYISFVRFCDEVNALILYERNSGRQYLAYEEKGYFGYPYWSPDGSSVVFIRYLEGETVLYRFVVNGWYVERLLTWTGLITSFSWSPDGEHLALSAGDNTRMVLYRFDLVDGRLTQLSEDDEFAYSPSWSPTGDWVAYIDSKQNSYIWTKGELILLDPFFSDDREVLASNVKSPIWSPGGDFLVVTDGATVRTLGIEDNSGIVVVSLAATVWPIEVSSDGEYVMLCYGASGLAECEITEFAGVASVEDTYLKLQFVRSFRALGLFPFNSKEPDWAPEGDLIVFTGVLDPKMP